MKYLLSAFALLFVLGACQKEINGEFIDTPVDTTDTNPVIPPTGIIRAKIDSVDWLADQSASAIAIPYDSGRHFFVTIIGTKTDGSQLGIAIEEFQLGTFRFVDSFFNDGAVTDATGEYNTSNGPSGVNQGIVTVTEIDTLLHTISGTFSFTAYDDSALNTRTVTNGEFIDVPYIKNAGIPPASPNDTFRVNIDSNLFTPYGILPLTLDFSGVTYMAIGSADSLGGKVLNLYMPYTITPGTYTFDGTAYRAEYIEAGRDTLRPAPSTGTLQITDKNTTTKRITGTFTFTGYNNASPPTDSAYFTSGFFSVVYP